MPRLLALTLAAASFFAPAAFAAEPASPTAAATAPAAPGQSNGAKAPPKPEDKLICRRETPVGSIMVKRVCKTQAQIDKERSDVDLMRDQVRINNGDVRPR
jgi:hypothetical protein